MRTRRDGSAPPLADEAGVALITVMLVTMVLISLSAAVVQLAIHSSESAAYDGKRMVAIHAAAERITTYVAELDSMASVCPDAEPVITSESPRTTSTLTVALVDAAGDAIACDGSFGPGDIPERALVTSSAITGTGQEAARTLQAEIPLEPFYGGLDKAIFGNASIELNNNNDITHDLETNDADIYSNGDITNKGYLIIEGDVLAQGNVDVTGCMEGNIWARGSVSVKASFVGGCNSDPQPGATCYSGVCIYPDAGHITASDPGSTITIASTFAYGDCRAGGTVSIPSNSACSSVRNPEKPQEPVKCSPECGYPNEIGLEPPPAVAMPHITYDAADWADWRITTYTDCTAAGSAIQSYLSGGSPSGWDTASDNLVRISPACTLTIAAGSYTVRDDLSIVTDGSIAFDGSHNWSAAPDATTVRLIRPWTDNLVCGDTGTFGPYDISFSQQTDLSGLSVFAYTPCEVLSSQQNRDFKGQVIAGQVTISNSMSLAYSPILVPGMVPTGFVGRIDVLREVAAGLQA
ncbi:MAG: hypothetical protein WD004_01820 [Actinomycetota bacterium]